MLARILAPGILCVLSAVGCWGLASASAAHEPDEASRRHECVSNQETDTEPSTVGLGSSGEDEFTFLLSNFFQEPLTPARPLLGEQAAPLPTPALGLTQDVFMTEELRRAASRRRGVGYPWGTSEFVLGSESAFRVSSDLGDLLDKSLSAPAARTQPRSPNTNDPRVRGGRAGRLVVSGSYWAPAREDLDTPLDKIDSRLLHDMVVIKGPYTARLGPALRFIDFQLLDSPRYDEGFRAFGSTALEYQTNGQQWTGGRTSGVAARTGDSASDTVIGRATITRRARRCSTRRA